MDLNNVMSNGQSSISYNSLHNDASYQGHIKKPSGSGPPKYQPYIFGGNTWLGFMVAGAAGGVGCKPIPCNQRLQQLQPP
jgi:hypothetical protein